MKKITSSRLENAFYLPPSTLLLLTSLITKPKKVDSGKMVKAMFIDWLDNYSVHNSFKPKGKMVKTAFYKDVLKYEIGVLTLELPPYSTD